MSKILEMIGFALIGGTIYSFIGMTESELRWPVFWSCAVGTLAIIVYRNYMRRRKKIRRYYITKQQTKLRIDRSIKEHFRVMEGEYDRTN
jgi:hypothetical protein